MFEIPCYDVLGTEPCYTIERHITRVEKISFTWHYGKVWQIP